MIDIKQEEGGSLRPIDMEVEKPKARGLFEQFTQITKEKKLPDEAVLYPIIKWASNCKSGIKPMVEANCYFFTVPKDVLTRFVFLNFPRQPFVSYPKKKALKDKNAKLLEEQIEIIKPYICRYYGWSGREFEYQRNLIEYNEELFKKMHQLYVLEDKELKKLGIKTKANKEKFTKPKVMAMEF